MAFSELAFAFREVPVRRYRFMAAGLVNELVFSSLALEYGSKEMVRHVACVGVEFDGIESGSGD